MGKPYVYHLVDPRDGKVFYVGKGRGNRVGAHEAEARRGVTSAKCMKIKEIWAEDLPVERRIVAICETDEEALRLEAKQIASMPGLTNVMLTGSGEPAEMTETRLRALAYIAHKSNGFKDRVRLDYPPETHRVWKMIFEVCNRAGIAEIARAALMEMIEQAGLTRVNKRMSKYGVQVV